MVGILPVGGRYVPPTAFDGWESLGKSSSAVQSEDTDPHITMAALLTAATSRQSTDSTEFYQSKLRQFFCLYDYVTFSCRESIWKGFPA